MIQNSDAIWTYHLAIILRDYIGFVHDMVLPTTNHSIVVVQQINHSSWRLIALYHRHDILATNNSSLGSKFKLGHAIIFVAYIGLN
jgi:hypothetical protein